MKNIILIGMMGCGKSTVGGILARALSREQVDTDILIETREGRSIPRIFAEDGEAYFRELELSLCLELAPRDGLVISCGGGLPLRPACMDALCRNGVVFWLNRDPEQTYDTLDTSGRPLAQGGRADFVARYETRAPVYRKHAHHIVDCSGGTELTAQTILRIVNEEEPV